MDNAILKNRDNNAQVALESCLVVVASIMLLLGMNAIWAWSNNNIAERQPDYNATRVEAGSISPGRWLDYAQRPLREEWVFAGVPVADAPENAENPETAEDSAGETLDSREARTGGTLEAEEKETQASENIRQAAILDYEAGELEKEAENLDAMADYYQALYEEGNQEYPSIAIGIGIIGSRQSYYKEQADYCRQQANQKRQLAQNKRDEADQLEADADELLDEAIEIREEGWQT
jgi:hypothetical protein